MIDRKTVTLLLERLAGLQWFPRDNHSAIKDLGESSRKHRESDMFHRHALPPGNKGTAAGSTRGALATFCFRKMRSEVEAVLWRNENVLGERPGFEVYL